jgi:hypothetical protein
MRTPYAVFINGIFTSALNSGAALFRECRFNNGRGGYGFAFGWDFKKALRASGMKAAVLKA